MHPRVRIVGGVAVAFFLGVAVGWGAAAGRAAAPRGAPTLGGIAEGLEFASRRTAAVAEILDDMAHGRIANDRPALAALRDSMQEITEELGDLRSQVRALVPGPAPRGCP